MKKFVSFCLLSIMLAFFGIVETKAQNCLWLQNVDSTVPSYMATVLQPARPDATDVYEVMFHNGSLDPNTKISLAWTISRNGTVLDNSPGNKLSDYVKVRLRTTYNELGLMGSPNYLNTGIAYQTGTDGKVVYKNGEPVYKDYPGSLVQDRGYFSIYENNFNYFFLHYFEYSQTFLELEWLYPGDYEISVSLVRRDGGTVYDDLHYDAAQMLMVGGHQSFVVDTIASFQFADVEIVDIDTMVCRTNLPFQIGNPVLSFDSAVVDTMVPYYDDITCHLIDTVFRLTLGIIEPAAKMNDSILYYCQDAVAPNLTIPPVTTGYKVEYSTDLLAWDTTTLPVTTTIPGIDTIYVRQYDPTANDYCPGEVGIIEIEILAPTPPPTLTISDTIDYCHFATAAPLDVTPDVNCFIEWSSDDTVWTTTPIVPATDSIGIFNYFVRQTDTSRVINCASSPSDTIVVYVLANPVVEAQIIPDTICLGSSARFTVDGNADSYLWSFGSNNQDTTLTAIIPEGTHTYYVTGSLDYDRGMTCTTTDTVTLMVLPLPAVEIILVNGVSDTAICRLDTAILASSPDTFVSYTWSTGADTSTIRTAAAGVYTLTVTDQYGCTNDTTFTLYVHDLPEITAISATNNELCSGENTDIWVTTDQPGYTFLWSNAGTDSTFNTGALANNENGPVAFLYTVTVTNPEGCENVIGTNDSIRIAVNPLPIPAIIPVGDTVICKNEEITLIARDTRAYDPELANPTTFTWQNAVANSDTSAVFASDNYTLPNHSVRLVAMNDYGCVDSIDKSNIEVRDTVATVISVSENAPYCEGQEVNLNAAFMSPTSLVMTNWVWSHNDTVFTQQIPATLAAGINTFYVTVTIQDEPCPSIATLTIDASTTPAVTLTRFPDVDSVCAESTMRIVATVTNKGAKSVMDYSYNWDTYAINSDTANLVMPAEGGMYYYSLTVTDLFSSCSKVVKDSIFVYDKVAPVLFINRAPEFSYYCSGDTVSLTPNVSGDGYTYAWLDGLNGVISTDRELKTAINTVGSRKDTLYRIQVTDVITACTNQTTAVLQYQPKPELNLQPDTAVCYGQPVTLTTLDSVGVNYVWYSSLGSSGNLIGKTHNINPTDSVTYVLTATSAFNCVASDTLRIGVNPYPISNITPAQDTICENEVLTISVDNNADYTYLWAGAGIVGAMNSHSIDVESLTAGEHSYYVTITDESRTTLCSIVDTATVLVNAIPVVTPYISNTIDICAGTDTLIGFNETAYTYLWSNDSTGNKIVFDSSLLDPYTDTTLQMIATITNALGCSIQDTIVVNVNKLPEYVIVSNPAILDDTVCINSSLDLIVSLAAGLNSDDYTYSWTEIATAPAVISTNDTITATTTENRTYEYFVTVTENGTLACASFDTISYIVMDYNLVIATDLTNDTACQNQPVTFTASMDVAMNNIKWYVNDIEMIGANSAVYVTDSLPVGNAVIRVTAEDHRACTYIADTAIFVRTAPSVGIIADNLEDTVQCANTPFHFVATGGVQYAWYINDAVVQGHTAATLDTVIAVSGDHFVTVIATDVYGCTNDSTLKITVKPLPSGYDLVVADTACANVGIQFALNYNTSADVDSAVVSLNSGADRFVFTDVIDTVFFVDPAYISDTDVQKIENISYSIFFDGCSITVDTVAVISSIPSVTYTSKDSICFTNDLLVTMNVCNTDWTYAWTPVPQDTCIVTFTPDSVGMFTYGVVITNSLGCSNAMEDTIKVTNQHTVTLTDDSFNKDPHACTGPVNLLATVDPSAGTYEYLWTTPTLTDIPGSDTYPADTTGMYYVSVEEISTGCIIIDSIRVYIDTLPYIDITPVGKDSSIYSMTGNLMELVNYNVIVRNDCGFAPGSRVQLLFDIVNNDGSTVTMDNWNRTNAISYYINSLASDHSTFTGVNVNSKFAINGVSGTLPTGNGTDEFTYALNGGPGVGVLKYQWLYLHFLQDRPVTVAYEYFTTPGTYTITYTLVNYPEDASGQLELVYEDGMRIGGNAFPSGSAVVLATRQIVVEIPELSTGDDTDEPSIVVTPTTKDSPTVNVYPNPAISSVNIEVKGFEGETNINIYDLNGRLIDNMNVNVVNSAKVALHVNNYSNGVYFVKVSNNEAVVTRKLVISK